MYTHNYEHILRKDDFTPLIVHPKILYTRVQSQTHGRIAHGMPLLKGEAKLFIFQKTDYISHAIISPSIPVSWRQV